MAALPPARRAGDCLGVAIATPRQCSHLRRHGVQVVFIPSGAVSLWFLRIMLHQHGFGAWSSPALKVSGFGARPSSVSPLKAFIAAVMSADVGSAAVTVPSAFSKAIAEV